MASVEVFLDKMPGETRGIIARDGLYHHLVIQRERDRPCDRLGAVLVGRAVRVEPALRGAFVDLGYGEPYGFLPLGQKSQVGEGARVEVEVTAEPRESKGPVLRLIGPATTESGLVRAGPGVAEILGRLAPRAVVQEGMLAVRAAMEAEEEALTTVFQDQATGLDLAVERTRALVSVDIDHRPMPGREGRKAREAVNWAGLVHTARILSLKGWGGLVVIDMVGTNLHGETVTRSVRTAFAAEAELAVGPLSRFGLMQLSLPWRRRPIEERLAKSGPCRGLETRALRLVRELNHALLTDLATARLAILASPEEATAALPYIERLGPRAQVVADAALGPGQFKIKEA